MKLTSLAGPIVTVLALISLVNCSKSKKKLQTIAPVVNYITNAEPVTRSAPLRNLAPCEPPPSVVFTGADSGNWYKLCWIKTTVTVFLFINLLELKSDLTEAFQSKFKLGLVLEAEEVQLLNRLDRDSLVGLVGSLKAEFEINTEKKLRYCMYKQPIYPDVETAFSIQGITCIKGRPWSEYSFSSDGYQFVDSFDAAKMDSYVYKITAPKFVDSGVVFFI